MLIRDWLENVKCTKRSTAGYHASMLRLSLFSTRQQPLSLSLSSPITPSFLFHLPFLSPAIRSSVHLLLLLLVLLLLLFRPSLVTYHPYSIRPPLPFHRLSLLHLSLSSSVRPTTLLPERAPDIYGIFLIARPLHSSLLARRPRSKRRAAACLRPRGPRGPRQRFNLHYGRCQCAAHTVPNCGQVLSRLFETRPSDIAYADLGEINPPAGVLES